MARTRRRGTGSPSSPAASREGGESDASGDTNVLPSSPESAMSLSDGEGGEGASDPPTTTEFLANDLGMRMPELAAVLHEVKTDKHVIQALRHSVHFKEEKILKVFFEGEPAVELWTEVLDKIEFAIVKYTPYKQKDVKRKTALYEAKKSKIVYEYIGTFDLTGSGDGDDEDGMEVEGEGSADDIEFEMTTLQILIGLQFVHHAHKLITPPSGVCYRLNANIAKGPTVGLRQQICSAKKTGKRSSKKTKRRQKKAAKEYESSDEKDVPFCYSEDELAR